MKETCDSGNTFAIHFDPLSLSLSERGAITSLVYCEFGDFCFPDSRWSDFVVVILGWWIDATNNLKRQTVLRFMDGPYSIHLTADEIGIVRADCIEHRERQIVLGSFHISLSGLQRAITVTALAVLDACQERNWNSEDLAQLRKFVSFR
jgi:hypothetical protein